MDDWSQLPSTAMGETSGDAYQFQPAHDRRDIVEHSKTAYVRQLSAEQRMTINTYENFGWTFYMRNAKSNSPIVFIVSGDKEDVLLVDEDGDLIEEHDIVYRH